MGGRTIIAAVLAALLPAPAASAEWLAGDLHVHTCFSHDAWCPAGDDNTGPDEFYTLSLGVEERFRQAAAQGLDYLSRAGWQPNFSPAVCDGSQVGPRSWVQGPVRPQSRNVAPALAVALRPPGSDPVRAATT